MHFVLVVVFVNILVALVVVLRSGGCRSVKEKPNLLLCVWYLSKFWLLFDIVIKVNRNVVAW